MKDDARLRGMHGMMAHYPSTPDTPLGNALHTNKLLAGAMHSVLRRGQEATSPGWKPGKRDVCGLRVDVNFLMGTVEAAARAEELVHQQLTEAAASAGITVPTSGAENNHDGMILVAQNILTRLTQASGVAAGSPITVTEENVPSLLDALRNTTQENVSTLEALAGRESAAVHCSAGANTSRLFPGGVPDNPDIVDLVARLDAERSKPADKRRSDNEVAREFTKEDAKKAASLLSQIRRLKRQGDISL